MRHLDDSVVVGRLPYEDSFQVFDAVYDSCAANRPAAVNQEGK